MLTRPRLIALSSGVALVAVAITAIAINTESRPAPQTSVPAAVLLTNGFESGMTRTYALTVDVDLQQPTVASDTDFSLSAAITWTVLRTFEDGSADLEMTLNDPIRSDGKTDQFDTLTPIELRVAPDGRVASSSGDLGLDDLTGADPLHSFGETGTQSTPTTLTQAFFPHFSDTAVRPGDVWEANTSRDLPLTEGPIVTTTRGAHHGPVESVFGTAIGISNAIDVPFTFAGTPTEIAEVPAYEDLIAAGREDAVITFDGNTAGDFTSFVSPTTGEVFQLTGKLTKTWSWTVTDGLPITFATTIDVKLTKVNERA